MTENIDVFKFEITAAEMEGETRLGRRLPWSREEAGNLDPTKMDLTYWDAEGRNA